MEFLKSNKYNNLFDVIAKKFGKLKKNPVYLFSNFSLEFNSEISSNYPFLRWPYLQKMESTYICN